MKPSRMDEGFYCTLRYGKSMRPEVSRILGHKLHSLLRVPQQKRAVQLSEQDITMQITAVPELQIPQYYQHPYGLRRSQMYIKKPPKFGGFTI